MCVIETNYQMDKERETNKKIFYVNVCLNLDNHEFQNIFLSFFFLSIIVNHRL